MRDPMTSSMTKTMRTMTTMTTHLEVEWTDS